MGITEIVSGIIIAIIGALGFVAKRMKAQRDDARIDAEIAKQQADTATQRANVQTDLGRAKHQAEVLKNEALKNRTTEKPPAGLDFNRNRMHDDTGKD